MARLRMSDKQWLHIQTMVPDGKPGGRPPLDRRNIVDGILWILRTGAPWRDVPEEFGKWQSIWRLFDQWNGDGTLDKILQNLQGEISINKELWCIDGTVIRAQRCAAGGGKKGTQEEPQDHALGRSRGGYSTKLHLLCDAEGHPLSYHLTAGQTHESTVVDIVLENADKNLLDGSGAPVPWPVRLAGDIRDASNRRKTMAQSLSKVLLHVVLRTKNREETIPSHLQAKLRAYLAGICRAKGAEAYRVGGTEDHVHIACTLPRTLTQSTLLEEIKKASSIWMKQQEGGARHFSWQAGYGIFSLGQSQMPTLIQYINNQEEHHRTKSFKEELLELLEKYDVEYDEKYLWD